MKTGLGAGLTGLLAKLGLGGPKAEETGVSGKGMQGEAKDAKGLEKGQALGDGTLLAGVGYNSEDRHAAMKNVAEKANIDRFMQDVSGDVKELQAALREMKDAESMPASGEKREAREADGRKEADGPAPREEAKKEEKAEDVRSQALEAKEKEKEKETAEARDRERERERERERDKDDDDDGHGHGWVQEELSEHEEEKKRRGLREADVMGEHVRCRGELEDGTRCLRKPVAGTPYCRAHAIPQA